MDIRQHRVLARISRQRKTESALERPNRNVSRRRERILNEHHKKKLFRFFERKLRYFERNVDKKPLRLIVKKSQQQNVQ